MDPLALVVAGVAAGAILLIVIGLAGNSPVDPVQARLTQLGTMQAKNLEELELQQPFIERTLRPLANRVSGSMSRVASSSFQERTEIVSRSSASGIMSRIACCRARTLRPSQNSGAM